MRITSLLLLAVGAATAPAADLSKIDRTIKKEPVYLSKSPKYGMLVFGPRSETRVWLVLDLAAEPSDPDGSKNFLYVDRNGDGDLTGADEKISCTPQKQETFASFSRKPFVTYRGHFEAGDVADRDGKTRHTGLTIDVDSYVQRYRPVSITVKTNGSNDQFAGGQLLAFADRPEDAPVVHFGGPLQMRLAMEGGALSVPICYDEQVDVKKWYAEHPPQYDVGGLVRGESRLLVAQVGTPGLGRGTFAALSAGIPPAGVHPVAELEIPATDPKGKAVQIKTDLDSRCCATLVRGKVTAPADVALGTARVTLSFPGWKGGAVAPVTGEVQVTNPVNPVGRDGTKE
jgi:hypothetical protein